MVHPSSFHSRLRASGFTLIEVMITVAIVAILASVALPAYTDYVRRGQMQEAFTLLADYGVRMEQYYQDNKNYGAASGTTCGLAAQITTQNTTTRYFTLSCTTASSGQTYTLTATGRAGAVAPSGGADTFVYTLNSNDQKATTRFAGNTVALSCWASRSGTACD